MFAYGYENDTLHASVITKKRCIVSFFLFWFVEVHVMTIEN